MKYAPGAPMNLTAAPPGWQITFTTDNETWTEPIIGWAIIATLSDGEDIDSDIEPVVLDSKEGSVDHLHDYLNNRSQPHSIKYSIQYRHPSV